MSKYKLFFVFILAICSHALFAEGIIRGVVSDGKTGESLAFANIFVTALNTGTTTDLDGNYNLELPEGKYSLVISYLGYTNYKVNEVAVINGKVNIINVQITAAGEVLKEVVVSAKQIRNTASAIATLQKKSTKLLNGIAAQTFSKMGDGNAADAIKRVSGVSTEGGKYVYVRGLGDRYTKTTLNGMAIPGLDPDKNTVRMDIFPTNVIDNIIVYKSFSPDLPADFTGGIVDIVTKDFPDQKSTKLSYSLGYNPNVNMNHSFLSYARSNTDKWGFDDGTRALPFHRSTFIPDESTNDVALFNLSNSFAKEMAAKPTNSGLNHSFAFSHGNQFNFKEKSIGFIAAVNYKNTFSHYQNAIFENYIIDQTATSMVKEAQTKGAISTHKILASGLAAVAFKTKSHKISANYILIQNGEDKVAALKVVDFDDNPSTILRDVLEYSQRTIHNIKVGGKHNFAKDRFIANWAFSPTWIEVDEPDIRSTGFEVTTDGKFLIQPSIGADISRTFRNLKETSYNGKVDVEYKLKKRGSAIKTGFNILNKKRDFSIQNYIFRVQNQGDLNLEGNPDNLFKTDNLWQPETEQGLYVKGNYEPANTFSAKQNILAAYLMTELALTPKFKAIVGARVEKVDNFYTGRNNQGTVILTNEKVLDELDVLPSSNFIYKLTENMNLRLSYNRTLARPSFKEKSIAQIQDRVSGRTFIGNLDLKETKINNLDFRWESFQTAAQMLSFSIFYKDLTNPIELESYNELSPDNYTPRNQAKATVYGVEIEARKNLDFISTTLTGFTASLNASYIKSRIKRENPLQIYDTDTRQLVGQSPYLINAALGYRNIDKGFDINVGYNVQGRKLSIIGIGVNPDVYEMPFHSLDAKASIRIGSAQNWTLSLSAGNLLASKKEFVYDGGSQNTGDYIWSFFNPGRDFSMGVSYIFR